MGLDMYLSAKKFVSSYSFQNEAENEQYDKVINAIGASDIASPDTQNAEVSVTVAYWRKANAIHGWFVKNVQDNVDDCGNYYVSRENLMELQALCKEIMDNPNKANELLPPQAGFFFGTDEVDEWYLEQNKYTYEQITALLEKTNEEQGYKGWTFEYHSSW